MRHIISVIFLLFFYYIIQISASVIKTGVNVTGIDAVNQIKIECGVGQIEVNGECRLCKNINQSCDFDLECSCGIPTHMKCWKVSNTNMRICGCDINHPIQNFPNVITDEGLPICIYSPQSSFLMYIGIASGVLAIGAFGMFSFIIIKR